MEPGQDRSQHPARPTPADRHECIALLGSALDWCDGNEAGFAAIHINQAIELLQATGSGAGPNPRRAA